MNGTTARLMSLAHLTVLDTTPPELVTVAAAAGFRSIGIRLTATPSVGVPPYTEEILRDGPLLRETLRRLADTGVSVLDTEFLRFEPEHPVGVPEGFLEVSARLGAKNVLVMSAEPEEARTLERFCELCDRAAGYGLNVGLEFAIYTGVRTLALTCPAPAIHQRSSARRGPAACFRARASCRWPSWSRPCPTRRYSRSKRRAARPRISPRSSAPSAPTRASLRSSEAGTDAR